MFEKFFNTLKSFAAPANGVEQQNMRLPHDTARAYQAPWHFNK